MQRRSLTDSDKEYLRANYLILPGKELSAKTGSSVSAIRAYFKSVGISVPKDVKERFRVAGMIGKTTFTPKEDAIIRKYYLKVPIKVLGEKYLNGRSFTGIMKRLNVMGLSIPAEIIAQRKADSLIKKGDVPPNKGRKQSEWMSADNIAKTAGTRFKKGNQPYNTKEQDGEITIRKDKSEIPYKYIRVSLGKWQLLQRHVWEQYHGKIPPGHVVIFEDGDSMNCDICNLKCISKAKNMERNSGPLRLPDGMVATYLAVKSKVVNKELRNEILKHPQLIKLKRNQLLLNRAIKNHGNNNASK
jgi:hypothetical protein